MKTKLIVRFISGREEQFELDLVGGRSSGTRLKEFAEKPTVVLQIENEVVIIPATAIESMTFSVLESAGEGMALHGVHPAKRLK